VKVRQGDHVLNVPWSWAGRVDDDYSVTGPDFGGATLTGGYRSYRVPCCGFMNDSGIGGRWNGAPAAAVNSVPATAVIPRDSWRFLDTRIVPFLSLLRIQSLSSTYEMASAVHPLPLRV
jgi:hypothetical protein